MKFCHVPGLFKRLFYHYVCCFGFCFCFFCFLTILNRNHRDLIVVGTEKTNNEWTYYGHCQCLPPCLMYYVHQSLVLKYCHLMFCSCILVSNPFLTNFKWAILHKSQQSLSAHAQCVIQDCSKLLKHASKVFMYITDSLFSKTNVFVVVALWF